MRHSVLLPMHGTVNSSDGKADRKAVRIPPGHLERASDGVHDVIMAAGRKFSELVERSPVPVGALHVDMSGFEQRFQLSRPDHLVL